MKKYYIGLAVIALFALGVTAFTIAQGLNSRQDNVTEKREREIIGDLNDYITTNRKLPASLDEAGIKDVPSTIRYEKVSEDTLKFCVTYKEASSYGVSDGITPLIAGRAISQYSEDDIDSSFGAEPRTSSYLYPSYYHKKGENCQTVKPYALQSSSSNYDNLYGLSPPASSSVSSKARDTERQTDIKALHSQLEAYYVQNGSYPALSQLNSKSFRTENMKGLDEAALKDPGSFTTAGFLLSTPGKNYYSYSAKSASGGFCSSECAKYTLTATLEDGTTYTKNSLN